MRWRRFLELRPAVILAGAWLFVFAYAFPGQFTPDTLDHLAQARSGFYTDGHPPAIVALFWLCDAIIPGTVLVLALQTTAFLFGLYALLKRTFRPRRAAWLAATLFLFPPVLAPMAVVWKDCVMAGLLVVAIAALRSERRTVRIVGILAITVATALRYNAVGATLPLVVLLFEWRPGLDWPRRYALAAGVWLATAVVAIGANAALTDRQMHIWHSSLALYDMVGTLAYLDEELPDAELERRFAGTELRVHTNIHATARAIYSPRDFISVITHPTGALWSMPIYGDTPAPAAQRDAVAAAWWDLLASYPGAYVQHRIAVMGQVLAVGKHAGGAVPKRSVKYPDYTRELGLADHWSPFQHRATAVVTWIWRHTPLFTPWVYLVIALLLLPLARQRDVLALLLSGLGMEGTLLLLAPSHDYRYSHWMIITTLLAVILLVARRARRPDASPR